MKKLVLFALILLAQTVSAQEFKPTFGLQISTFPVFQATEGDLFSTSLNTMSTEHNPHCIEPGFVVSFENQKTFHNLVFNPLSKTVTNLNILIGKRLDYYCFVSYTPHENFWFSSLGVAKSFEVAESMWLTPYVECGFNPIDPKDGSLIFETGIIYSLDFNFKKSKG